MYYNNNSEWLVTVVCYPDVIVTSMLAAASQTHDGPRYIMNSCVVDGEAKLCGAVWWRWRPGHWHTGDTLLILHGSAAFEQHNT